MTDQPNEPAEALAGTDDGFIDFDKLAAAEPPVSDIEDGELNVEDDAEPAEKTEDTPDAAAEAKKAADAEAKTKLSGAQRNKILQQELREEIAKRDREIEALRSGTKQPAVQAGADDPKAPKEEDFNGDFLAFTVAKATFEARKEAENVLKSSRDREATDNAAEQAEAAKRQRELDHEERVTAAKSVITDFDTVMESMKGVEVRDDLIEEIMSSKNSAVIAYHLAQNPSELEALNRMSPRELAREMGRLEATVKLPEAKTKTSAPPPLSKVKGAATPPSQEKLLSAYLDKKYGTDRKR
jgi:hypothetical protein